MPIVEVPLDEVKNSFTFEHQDSLPEDDVTPSWMEAAGASFEHFNILSSSIAYNKGHPGPLTKQEKDEYVNGSFNPLESVKGGDWDSPEYLDHVSKVRSQRELNWLVQNFERERNNDDILARSSTTQAITTGIAAGVLDPVMAPTLAIPAIRASMIARIGTTSGTAAGLALLDEILLHETQFNRTLSESALNIGGAAIFGALLGPFGRNTTQVEAKKILNSLEDELHGVQVFMGDSASAAKVQENLPEGFMDEMMDAVQLGKITEAEAAVQVRNKRLDMLKFKREPIFKFFAFGSPVLRVGTSNSVKARSVLENLVEDSFIRTKNEFGFTSGPSVETLIKGEINTKLATVHQTLNEQYSAYIGSTNRITQITKGMKKDTLSFDEFASEVGKAQMRSDVHEIAEVAAAAARIRSDVNTPLEAILVKEKMLKTEDITEDVTLHNVMSHYKNKDKIVKSKLTKEEAEAFIKKEGKSSYSIEVMVDKKGKPKVKKVPTGKTKAKLPPGDESYFPRVYNFDKIIDNRMGFKQAIAKSIRSKIKDPEDLAKFEEPNNLRIFMNELDDTISKIVSSPTGFFDRNIVPESGFLKKRKITISTKDLEDWLVTDVRVVNDSYLRGVIPHLELGKRFSGSDLAEELTAIEKEYSTLIEKLPPNSKKVVKLNRELERVKKDVTALRDILLNRYKRPEDPTSVWNKAGHLVRAHNYVTSLGGMTVASIPDIGNVIARVGLKPFSKGIISLVTMPKKFNLSRKEAKKMAAGLDVMLHTRAQSLMMAEEHVTFQGKFDQMVDKTVKGFGKATGMTYWNAGLKQFAGTIYLDEIGVMLGKTLNKNQITKLAAAGIDSDMLTRIRAQWQKHGTIDEGLNSPNIDSWTDIEAKRTLSSAVLKEVDTAVVTPGAGDLPLFARSPVGKVISQFKTFVFASHNRIFLANVQRLGFDQTMGFLAMMSLGAASYGMKQWAAGREPATDWNTISREMIDRSGYFGYMSDLNAITEKLSRGKVGVSALLGGEPLTRYRAKSVVGDLLGPTAGKSADYATAMGTISAAMTGGEISESDIRALRRLFPYQNLFYIRRFLNQLEEGAAEEFADK